MMQRLRVCALLLFSLLASLAQAADDITPEQRKLAQDYFRISGFQDMYTNKDRVLDMVSVQMRAMEAKYAEKMTPEQAQSFHQLLQGFSPVLKDITVSYMEKMKPELVDAVAQSYSADELRAMNEFYSSDIGKRIVAKNPEFTNRIMTIAGSYTADMMQQLQISLSAQLQEWSRNSKATAPAGKK
jgi:hypothetical protein